MSYYREQLEQYLKKLDINVASVLDIGGGQNPVKNRVGSWKVEDYKILDNNKEFKPDIFHDMNYPLNEELDLSKLNNVDLAYLAGIIDGEGCISLNGRNNKFSVSLGINMADSSGLRVFQKVFNLKPTNFIASDNKPYFNIQVSGEKLKEILLMLYPYLKVKRREAELGLLMRASIDSTKGRQRTPKEGGGSEPLSKEIIDSRNKLINESKEIKAGKYRNFDVIFCLEVAEYIWSPIIFHENLWYLLKPNGLAYVSYPTIYPTHNPVEYDYLRYSERAIKKYAELSRLTILSIVPRVASVGNEPLSQFYRAENMHPVKNSNLPFHIGYIVEFTKNKIS